VLTNPRTSSGSKRMPHHGAVSSRHSKEEQFGQELG
jgi:hypothetical protein